jgi:surfeit locus 1 family protein
MIGFRPRFWPTVVALPIVLICTGLGVWQVHLLHWKEGLIAARAAAFAAPPAAAPQSKAAAEQMAFRRVGDTGVFLNDKEILVAAISQAGASGFDVFTPLREPGGRIVFVNRGFVPTELKDRSKRAAGELQGTVRVVGLLQLPPAARPNWFVPNNRPDLNEWFWVDLPAMVAADKLDHVAGFYIDADATPNPGGWPQGGSAPTALPNHHLQYAITWFSLAVAMIVVYVLSHRRNRVSR